MPATVPPVPGTEREPPSFTLDTAPRVSPHARGRSGFLIEVQFWDATRRAFLIAEADTGRALRVASLLRAANGSRAYARTMTLAREVMAADLDALGVPPGTVREAVRDTDTGRLTVRGPAVPWRP